MAESMPRGVTLERGREFFGPDVDPQEMATIVEAIRAAVRELDFWYLAEARRKGRGV